MRKVDYSRYYLKWHKDDADHLKYVTSHYRSLIGPHLPANKDEFILDIGCGTGLALLFLRGSGYHSIKGVDTDTGQVKIAQSKNLPVSRVEDTVVFLHKHRNTAGCILCLDVLEHIPKENQIEFLAGIFEALKPGGKLILTTPNANSALAARWRYNDWTHQTSFTEHSLDFVLYQAGFHKIEVYPAEFIQRPRLFFLPIGGSRHWWALSFFRLLHRLQMMAELGPEQGKKVPLSLNLLAVANKTGEA